MPRTNTIKVTFTAEAVFPVTGNRSQLIALLAEGVPIEVQVGTDHRLLGQPISITLLDVRFQRSDLDEAEVQGVGANPDPQTPPPSDRG